MNPETLTQQTYDAISNPLDGDHLRWGWERFDRRFRPRTFWRAIQKGLSDADAEDCASKVMVKMLEHAPHFYDSNGRSRESHGFRAFLFRVTDNQAKDIHRANEAVDGHVATTPDLDTIASSEDDSGDDTNKTSDGSKNIDLDSLDGFSESVLLALKELKRRRGGSSVKAFFLRVMTDMTWAEIAAETGLKPNTAMTAHRRCKQWLETALNGNGDDAA